MMHPQWHSDCFSLSDQSHGGKCFSSCNCRFLWKWNSGYRYWFLVDLMRLWKVWRGHSQAFGGDIGVGGDYIRWELNPTEMLIASHRVVTRALFSEGTVDPGIMIWAPRGTLMCLSVRAQGTGASWYCMLHRVPETLPSFVMYIWPAPCGGASLWLLTIQECSFLSHG